MAFKLIQTFLLSFCMLATCIKIQAQNLNDSVRTDTTHRIISRTNYRVLKTVSNTKGIRFNPKYKRQKPLVKTDTTYTHTVTKSKSVSNTRKTTVTTQRRTYSQPASTNIRKRSKLMVCPNPAEDVINIKGWSHQETTLEIFSSAGQRVINLEHWNGESIIVSDLPSGYYNIRINKKTYIQFVKL